MTRRLRLGAQVLAVALVAALFALLVWKLAHEERSGVANSLREGKRVAAPEFTLARIDAAGELSLASLRGKAVVINFFASWCDPCKEEAGVLEAAWRKYRSRGLVMVGVDYNDLKSEARAFARRHGMTYPLVHDRDGDVLNAYGATGIPETFFVDRDGILVASYFAGAINSDDDKTLFERNIERALRS